MSNGFTLAELRHDVLYGIRLLRRSPAYSIAVVTVIAVGIAANVIAFSLFKAVALAPLAGVRGSGSLLFVGSRTSAGQVIPLSYPDYLDLRRRTFPSLAAWGLQPLILTHGHAARIVQTELVTGNYFDVLQVRTHYGRAIAPGDAMNPGQQPVAVLSDGLWRRVFGADPMMVGATIRINDHALTVIGVADEGFKGGVVGLATDLFIPVTMQAVLTGANELDARDDHWLHSFMRPPASMSRRQLDTLRSATSIYETLARMLTLIGALGVIISALGVYGLVAYTVKQQAHAIGVRTALGAPRHLIVRHFVQDGAWLAAIGTVVGVLLSLAFGRLMSTLLFGVASTDVASFAGATLIVVASALLASMVPAWRAVARDPIAALRHQ